MATRATMPNGISVVTVYVDDFARALEFYRDVLGLEKRSDMGPEGCLFAVGAAGPALYLEGGHAPTAVGPTSARTSFAFEVESAGALHRSLAATHAELLHDAPQPMGEGVFWFLFRDPCGNILEAVGGP